MPEPGPSRPLPRDRGQKRERHECDGGCCNGEQRGSHSLRLFVTAVGALGSRFHCQRTISLPLSGRARLLIADVPENSLGTMVAELAVGLYFLVVVQLLQRTASGEG